MTTIAEGYKQGRQGKKLSGRPPRRPVRRRRFAGVDVPIYLRQLRSGRIPKSEGVWERMADRFGIADYSVFGGMLLTSIVIGLRMGAAKKGSAAQFLTGNGDISTIPVALSMLAGFLSSITLIGQPAEVYLYGAQQWLFGFATFLLIPIVGYYLIPFFRERNYFSAYQYFGERFNRRFQLLASFLFTIQMILYLALVLYAPALAMHEVTGMNTLMVVTVMYLVCLVYTILGGITAVIWTDSFQVIVIFISLIVILAKGTYDVGGIKVIWERNDHANRTNFFNFDLSPTERYTFWSSFIGSGFLHMSTYGGNQLQIQRYLSVRSNKEARKMLWINTIGWTVVVLLCVYAGLLMFAEYYECDPLTSHQIKTPDQVFPFYVMEKLYVYPGLPGLFISGIFSAGLSTVSTGVNSLAAIWFAELEGTKFRKNLTETQTGMTVKLLALLFGVLSYTLVFAVPYMGGLAPLAVSLSSIFAGSLLGIFILGTTFRMANTTGATVGLLSSVIFLGWICSGNSRANARGDIVHPPLPLSIEGCPAEMITPAKMVSERETAFYLFRISYTWYCMIAILGTVIIGLIASYITDLISNCRKPRTGENDVKPNEPALNNLLLNEKEMKIITDHKLVL
ncbi:solute carrier family 5 [Nesidiocoris tenuis]|uniref:Solute carrier family 5 n=1 Tax=Nesidiocoris tenuis TaxID=355587 RepID=A0ABN7AR80_9HEMI|nr:solute carrier family 5 [Nesidiocoris tenuis]